MLIASRYQLAKDSDPKLMMAYKNRFELLRDSKSQCTFTTRGLMASRGPTSNPSPFSGSLMFQARFGSFFPVLILCPFSFFECVFFSSATLAAAQPFCIQWTGGLGPRKAKIQPNVKRGKNEVVASWISSEMGWEMWSPLPFIEISDLKGGKWRSVRASMINETSLDRKVFDASQETGIHSWDTTGSSSVA